MGLLSKVFLLFCCMALFNFKRKNCKSECDASNDAAYDDGYNAAYDDAQNAAYDDAYNAAFDDAYEAGKKDGCDSGNQYVYEYGYQYYEDLYSECQRDSDCLESDKPKCISGACKELSGGVLIIGGAVTGGDSNNVVKMGECASTANSLPQRSYLGAAAVYDNLVFQCGGHTKFVVTDKCYIRSPSGQWTEGPSLHRGALGMTLNKVGSTLVAIGGSDGVSRWNSVEILHPGSVSWEQQTYTINPARYYHCAVTISSTQVFLAGGYSPSGVIPNTEMLNLNTGSITRYADLPIVRGGHTCVLHQGRILLAGGHTGYDRLSQVLTLDYSNQGNSWISTTSMINARQFHSMNIVHGVLTVYGGTASTGSVPSMEQYVGGVWKSQVLTPPRYGHTSVVIC